MAERAASVAHVYICAPIHPNPAPIQPDWDTCYALIQVHPNSNMNFNNFGPEALSQIILGFLQSQPGLTQSTGSSQIASSTNDLNNSASSSLSTNIPAPSQLSSASGPSQPNDATAFTSSSTPFSAASLMAHLAQAQPTASTNAAAGPSQTPSGGSSLPIAPYASVNMLNAVANSAPLQPPRDGRPRVTTQNGFPSIDLIRAANNARLDHAAVSLPPKRPGPCSKAKKPPTLIEQQQRITIDDCLRVTEGEKMVLNLAINVYPPQPPNQTLTVFGLPRYLVKYTRHQDSFNILFCNHSLFVTLPFIL
ncbi:hypothetical protein AAF712_012286 [Marasmius tenuissimus]|uniref:Uncharacterized protein n=1 Tax=Marasmius tenuissimus TaxID=585030 RepID=A0ABR2ZIU9_9AGAR